jgi:hypothetical protein
MYALAIIARLTDLYVVEWFSGPVRVDVVRVGKSKGAFTSNNPTRIVVASADESYDNWVSTEMLFHESSHALWRRRGSGGSGNGPSVEPPGPVNRPHALLRRSSWRSLRTS